MRQRDGSDLLGQGDSRKAEIGIIDVDPDDSRQEILTAINTQELQGRKQIAIVLPDQGKAFRQPVEFDGLKNMRRGLKAQLVFIASPGPGPAEFARHRRFVVYSSLDTFKAALENEEAPRSPRAKGAGADKKPKGRASKEPAQNAPSAPPVIPIIAPTPPTPRIQPAASVQPVIPPMQPRPVPPPVEPDLPAASATPPFEDIDTQPTRAGNQPARPTPGAGPDAQDDDDDLAPIPLMTPRQPQSGPPARPDVPGRIPGGRQQTPLRFGPPTETPRPGEGGALPAARAGSQHRSGPGKPPPTQGRGTKQLNPDQNAPDASEPPKRPGGKGDSGSLPIVAPVPVLVPAALGGSGAPPADARGGNPPVPAPAPVTGTPPGSSATSQRQTGLTPLPPPVSQRRRRARGRRRLLVIIGVILVLLLIGWFVANASGGNIGGLSFGTLTATVHITPQSQVVQNSYVISAVTTQPDPAQRQVAARVLTSQSGTRQASGKATGVKPPTQAVGQLTFLNNTSSGVTIPGGTVITGKSGVAVTFNGSVFVPATGANATVNAYAVQAGAQGNIPLLDINVMNCCGINGITVKNSTAFTGGRNAETTVSSDDVNRVAGPVVSQLEASVQQGLQGQLKSNERLADEQQQCSTTKTSNPAVGAVTDASKDFSVTVTVTCPGEAFDYAAAQQMASNLLLANPQNSGQQSVDLSGYQLARPLVTTLTNATVVSGEQQISLTMQAAGKWVYQFNSTLLQEIRQKLVGVSQANAQTTLNGYMGIARATITLSSGSTMPSSASNITLDVATVPGLSPSAPTLTPTIPTSAAGGGGSPVVCPSPTPSPKLSGGGPC